MMTELRMLGWSVFVVVLMFVLFVVIDAVLFVDPPAIDSIRGREIVAELRCKFQQDSCK